MQEVEKWSKQRVEKVMGNILRIGVIASATLISTGGILYLSKYGKEIPSYKTFQGEPKNLSTITGTLHYALALHSRGIIQLGLLLLMGVPIFRVLFSAFAFLMQRDYIYLIITLFVLVTLLYSFLG